MCICFYDCPTTKVYLVSAAPDGKIQKSVELQQWQLRFESWTRVVTFCLYYAEI